MIQVKILSLAQANRYAVRRILQAAHAGLRAEFLTLEMEISEVSDPGEIGKYSYVLVLPTLVMNEKVVCSGRVSSREEMRGWLKEDALIDAQKGG